MRIIGFLLFLGVRLVRLAGVDTDGRNIVVAMLAVPDWLFVGEEEGKGKLLRKEERREDRNSK